MTKAITAEHVLNDLRYLTLLARSFPTVADASTEIINLEAILNLPKGTEHFLSDIHGEHQAFNHVLKNASGAIKRKVNEIFSNTLRDFEKKELCTLIYYPEQKLELIRQREKDLAACSCALRSSRCSCSSTSVMRPSSSGSAPCRPLRRRRSHARSCASASV